MDDKVRELYNGHNTRETKQNKRVTIGDIFYDYHERKHKHMVNRERLIKKLKRENEWKLSEEY